MTQKPTHNTDKVSLYLKMLLNSLATSMKIFRQILPMIDKSQYFKMARSNFMSEKAPFYRSSPDIRPQLWLQLPVVLGRAFFTVKIFCHG